jgi:hypothetical protein
VSDKAGLSDTSREGTSPQPTALLPLVANAAIPGALVEFTPRAREYAAVPLWFSFSGARCRNRTYDLSLMRRWLCQLS